MTLAEHYSRHKEEKRLATRHGMVEFAVSMKFIREILAGNKSKKIIDIGAGTGRYSIELAREGYDVTAVELVPRNLKVLESAHERVKCWPGDARNMGFLDDGVFDLAIFFGPLYHLHGDTEKLRALREAARVTKKGGIIMAAHLMNDYSILTYCFREERILELAESGRVDSEFHVRPKDDEPYDYVRLEDIDRLNAAAGLERISIFSPDGPSDFMRRELNSMSEESFQKFIEYQMKNAARPELLGAGSHIVDVLRVSAP